MSENLTIVSLWKLQRMALEDAAAAQECANRYAAERFAHYSDVYKIRVAKTWLGGLRGEENPFAHRRGGNFSKPLRVAYEAGQRLRLELTHVGRDVLLEGGVRAGVVGVVGRDRLEVQFESGTTALVSASRVTLCEALAKETV